MRRGATLLEVLVVAVLGSVIMGGLLQAVIGLWNSYGFTTGVAAAQRDATEIASQIAAEVRKAAPCVPKSGCGGTRGLVVTFASSTRIGFYSTPSGSTTQYFSQNGNVYRESGGLTNVMEENAGISLQYYQSSSYNVDGLATFTPTAQSYANVVAVQITATVTRNGVTGSDTALVRLRNGPIKLSASE
jgi:hypothetical protein